MGRALATVHDRSLYFRRRGFKRSVASTSISVREDQVPSPKELLGFRVGDDRKLAGWSQIVDYFQMLGGRSERIRVDEIGKSTEGNPFIVATISSPDTISELDRHLESQQRLADPRTIDDQTAAAHLPVLGEVRLVWILRRKHSFIAKDGSRRRIGEV